MLERLDPNSSNILTTLLTHENPHRAEYDRLIAQCTTGRQLNYFDTPYASDYLNTLERYTPEKFRMITDGLKGNLLLDLGEGCGEDSDMGYLAEEAGASMYISVDRCVDYSTENLDPTIALPPRMAPVNSKIPKVQVRADMLDFLSRMPTASACITMNGIDLCIIKDREYHRKVADEIIRVSAEGGIIFGNSSDALYMAAGSDVFKTIPLCTEDEWDLKSLLMDFIISKKINPAQEIQVDIAKRIMDMRS